MAGRDELMKQHAAARRELYLLFKRRELYLSTGERGGGERYIVEDITCKIMRRIDRSGVRWDGEYFRELSQLSTSPNNPSGAVC
jgi:hypothetical protein